MTPQEYIIWLDGFLEAVKDLNLTSDDLEKCWNKIQSKAHSIKDSETPSTQWTPPYKNWVSSSLGTIPNYFNTTTT
jgi:hypothetical protein